MLDITMSQPKSIYDTAKNTKEPDEHVNIRVSFQIIQQFSKELYDNPRRAIEELVCNSYDAGATECHISTPNQESPVLFVLDNGDSMDMDGLEWLWRVAESRKAKELGDERVQHDRQQIGKFGVGKLASFALGSRLTHMATKDGVTRVISVHQDRLRGSYSGDGDEGEPFGVREYNTDEARDTFGHFFDEIPNPWDEGWDSWTLAVVSDVPVENIGGNLQPWHLHRMIPTAVPSHANFVSYLNGERLEPQKPPVDEKFTVDVTEEEYISNLQDRLKRYWADVKEIDKSDVDQSLYEVEITTFGDPANTNKTIAGVHVPELGNVHGKAIYYDGKLTTEKREDRDYDEHGFRVYVRGRLLNKNDIRFGLENLSYQTWIRFRAELEIPGLDKTLRVHRESTQDEQEVEIAEHVLRASFNVARQKARELKDEGGEGKGDAEDPLDRPFSDRLKMRSPWYGPQAVLGLVESEDVSVNLDEIDIRTTTLRSTDMAVEFDAEEASFLINESHPLFDTLDRKGGFTKNIEDAFSEILAARLLIHGYLRYKGADRDALAASRQIFDAVLRSAAGSIGQDEIDYQLAELEDASIEGGDRFEEAIVDIFTNIGLAAVQEGGPDTHDGILTIPRTGNPNLDISLEAKGRQGIATHKDVQLDNINRHRVEQNCNRSVVIARKFQIDGRRNNRSALLRNADEEINGDVAGKTSFMTTKAFEVFLRLHYEQPFTYSETIKILSNKEDPDDIPRFIVKVWESKPDDQLTRRILDAAHDFMEGDDTNPPAIGTLTAHEKVKGTPRHEITARLEALDKLSESVEFDEDQGTIEIDAPPSVVVEEVDEAETNAERVLGDIIVQSVEKDQEDDSG